MMTTQTNGHIHLKTYQNMIFMEMKSNIQLQKKQQEVYSIQKKIQKLQETKNKDLQ